MPSLTCSSTPTTALYSEVVLFQEQVHGSIDAIKTVQVEENDEPLNVNVYTITYISSHQVQLGLLWSGPAS